jgi:hypothetical protein
VLQVDAAQAPQRGRAAEEGDERVVGQGRRRAVAREDGAQ